MPNILKCKSTSTMSEIRMDPSDVTSLCIIGTCPSHTTYERSLQKQLCQHIGRRDESVSAWGKRRKYFSYVLKEKKKQQGEKEENRPIKNALSQAWSKPPSSHCYFSNSKPHPHTRTAPSPAISSALKPT